MNVVAPSITLVKRVKAPQSRVWAHWTQPELMLRWFGPHHAHAQHTEGELRVGGGFRAVLREETGATHEAVGRYTSIEPETRLVFDWHWASTPHRVSRVTVELRPIAQGTEVTLTHDRFADEDTAKRHVRGWTQSLERLEALFAGD